MDKFSGVLKGGWHPEKSGTSLNPFNRNKTDSGSGSALERAQNHQSAPLSTLKDPDSFAPPPKHVAYYGSGAAAASPTTSVGARGASPQSNVAPRQPQSRRAQEEAEAEAQKPRGPYKVNHTGLDTSNLPPPPKFMGQAGGQSAERPRAPPRAPVRTPTTSTIGSTSSSVATAGTAPKPKPPGLPPRLPPRQNENPNEHTPPPPPSYGEATTARNKSYVNQDARNRLGKSGINVPGLNIGSRAAPVSASTTSGPAAAAQPTSTASELSSRFARMNTSAASTTSPATQSPPQAGGTTFAQKQAALKTATAFRNDPSSVSLSDARAAASTANNFRERHGEQVAGGFAAAQGFNNKYGVVNKVNGFAGGGGTAGEGAAGKRPPPPLPPPKKRELQAGDGDGPPPIPMGSKPRPV